MKKLNLVILTQESRVFSGEAELIMLPAVDGQIGILPGHVSLLTQLAAGEMFIFSGPKIEALAVSGGTVDVHNNEVTVLADSAVRAEDIDLIKVEAAKEKAEATLKQQLSDREYTLAEADLRRAVLELKVARRQHYRRSIVDE